jgi:hypothetical protein
MAVKAVSEWTDLTNAVIADEAKPSIVVGLRASERGWLRFAKEKESCNILTWKD